MSDAGRLAAMAAEARRAAEREFSIEREVERIQALYARLGR